MAISSSLRSFTYVVAITAVVSLGLYGLMVTSPGRQGMSGLGPGNPAPPIVAEGWLNGEPPKVEELAGKVIVVDAWASWCGPCRREAPLLVEVHKTYRDRGVVFIGLTAEGTEDLPDVRSFLEGAGITWPNGYGAVETLTAFGPRGIPAVWVIDSHGTIVWNRDSSTPMETAIDQALADAQKPAT